MLSVGTTTRSVRRARRAPLLALALAGGTAATAHAQLVSYEGFYGGPRPSLDGFAGGGGWSEAWSEQSWDLVTEVSAIGLAYPGLPVQPGCAVSQHGGEDWSGSQYQRSFPLPITSNAVYVSFLLRQNAATTLWGGLSFNAFPYRVVAGMGPGSTSYSVRIDAAQGANSSVPVVPGQTAFLVVRIAKNPSGVGCTYALFVNPQPGAPEPAAASATFTVNADPSLPTAVMLDNNGDFATDEIRVGGDWASVAPAADPCPGDFNGDGIVNGADLGILLGAWTG